MSESFDLVPNQRKKITLTCGDQGFAPFRPILLLAFAQVEADVQHELVFTTLHWLSLSILLVLTFTRQFLVSEEL